MAEDLKELIEKIQLEGVKAAEDKALAIETHARKRADEIMAHAAKEAERITSEAGERIKALEEGAGNSIKQASRDTMLSLRREIASTLELLRGLLRGALNDPKTRGNMPPETAQAVTQMFQTAQISSDAARVRLLVSMDTAILAAPPVPAGR